MPAGQDCSKNYARLFSESQGRYIIEVAPENFGAFIKAMINVPFGQIGKVVLEPRLTIKSGAAGVIDLNIEALKAAWQKPLKW